MIGEQTSEGWEVRLKPHGIGRFFGAAFLAVWLIGWVVGEAFALAVLVMGVRSIVTGEPMRPGQEPLAIGAAIVAGAFLLVWLAFWTFGGIAAMGELLRLLWAEDRVIARADGITILHHYGPFRSKREVARQELRWIEVAPCTSVLRAETTAKDVELSKLGSREDRTEVATMLRERLGLAERVDPASEPGALPEGWEEAMLPEGDFALIADHRRREDQARVVGVIAAFAGAVAVYLAIRTWNERDLLPLLVTALAAAAAIGWGAYRLHHVRGEWRIGSGSLTLRRRYGSKVRDVFEARSLELTVSADSDGDEWFTLEALAGAEAEPVTFGRRTSRSRRRIMQAIHEPSAPRRIGAWLAQRADVPFRDRTGAKARAAEMQHLRDELEKSGRFGKLVVRLVDRTGRGGGAHRA